MKTRIKKILASPAFWLGVGVLIRLIWILLVEVEQVSDARWYHQAAKGIAESGSYLQRGQPTAFFPIGYPAFLAGLYVLFGAQPFIGQLANVLLSALLLFFGYELSGKWFSEKIALLTLIILALYPNYIAYCSLELNELFFTTLLLGGFWFWENTSKQAQTIGTGICWAIACHIKPWLVLLPLVLLIGNRKYFPLKGILSIYLLILLFTLPWAYRNAQQVGTWVPFATNGGINLLIGNNPHANGTYHFEGEVEALLDSSQTEVERNQQASSLAFSYLLDQPAEALLRVPLKWYYLFQHGNEGFYWLKMGETNLAPGLWRWGSIAGQAVYLLVISLSILFLFKTFLFRHKNTFNIRTALAFICLLIFVYSCFFGYSRYHFPMIPFLIMFATAGVVSEK